MDYMIFINMAITVIGIPAIIKTLITIGGRLEKLDAIEQDIKYNMKPDLKDIREKFFALDGRLSWIEKMIISEKGSKV